MAGGAIGDGVIVDLSRLRRIVASERRRSARIVVEPGVLREEVNRAVAAAWSSLSRRSIERKVLHDRRHGVDERGWIALARVRLDAALGAIAALCVRRRDQLPICVAA